MGSAALPAFLCLFSLWLAACEQRSLPKNLPEVAAVFAKPDLARATCNHHSPLNYVLALAHNMQLNALCPYIRSLHSYSPSSRLILFVEMNNPKHHLELLAMHATPIEIQNAAPGYNWMVWRFFAHFYMLDWCHHKMLGVMITDVRDAVIQGPFWHSSEIIRAVQLGYLIFSLESFNGSSWTLGTEKLNKNWIDKCFPDMAPSLYNKPISCAGVTIGCPKEMLNYVGKMLELIAAAPGVCHAAGQGVSGDQAAHNLLLHTGMVKAVGLGNGDSPIFTVPQGLPLESTRLGVVVQRKGDTVFTPSILHQYDRSTNLKQAIMSHWACMPPMTFT
jgi:hypothetical protein